MCYLITRLKRRCLSITRSLRDSPLQSLPRILNTSSGGWDQRVQIVVLQMLTSLLMGLRSGVPSEGRRRRVVAERVEVMLGNSTAGELHVQSTTQNHCPWHKVSTSVKKRGRKTAWLRSNPSKEVAGKTEGVHY
eukprot:sb/3474839/